MSDNTKIEWTDATWNPLVGCSRVSQGCVNCYAERHAYRFARQAGTVYEGTAKLVNGKPTFTGRVNLNLRALDQPLRWKRPRRIFVNSMSDVFHESVANETIAAIFGVMAAAPQHVFQVLTKRPERAVAWFDWHAKEVRRRDLAWEKWRVCEDEAAELLAQVPAIGCLSGWPLRNVWLGVSVEDQEAADERIPQLLRMPAAVRFLSCEPLLGPLSFDGMFASADVRDGTNMLEMLDWVIAGGESGPRARPMHPDWARSLRDQCAKASVPFFFKQWGEFVPHEQSGRDLNECYDHSRDGGWIEGDGRFAIGEHAAPIDAGSAHVFRLGKKLAGRALDGVVYSEFPRAA